MEQLRQVLGRRWYDLAMLKEACRTLNMFALLVLYSVELLEQFLLAGIIIPQINELLDLHSVGVLMCCARRQVWYGSSYKIESLE